MKQIKFKTNSIMTPSYGDSASFRSIMVNIVDKPALYFDLSETGNWFANGQIQEPALDLEDTDIIESMIIKMHSSNGLNYCPSSMTFLHKSASDVDFVEYPVFEGLTFNDGLQYIGFSKYNVSSIPAVGTTVVKAKQTKADKRRISNLNFKLRSGIAISNEEGVFLVVGDSALSTKLMTELQANTGFDGLIDAGLSEAQAFKVLAVYDQAA